MFRSCITLVKKHLCLPISNITHIHIKCICTNAESKFICGKNCFPTTWCLVLTSNPADHKTLSCPAVSTINGFFCYHELFIINYLLNNFMFSPTSPLDVTSFFNYGCCFLVNVSMFLKRIFKFFRGKTIKSFTWF